MAQSKQTMTCNFPGDKKYAVDKDFWNDRTKIILSSFNISTDLLKRSIDSVGRIRCTV